VEVHCSPSRYAEALDAQRVAGAHVGLVPTMGALHAGHRSLIERAAGEQDVAAVTIFVNPLQFGEGSDLAAYPRTREADLELCERAGVFAVLVPEVADVYPTWPDPPPTTVSVTGVSERWEGASRPGHFDGVATVVAKLFALTGRCTAYFGEKDFQQLAVVRAMAADLSFPVEVVGCPTVRDPDGLALSSRNARLSPEERRAALSLSRALNAGCGAVAAGERRPEAVAERMGAVLEAETLASLDYAAVVHPSDLQVPARLSGGETLRLLVAAQVGPVRLIDNVGVRVPEQETRAAGEARPAPAAAGAWAVASGSERG
jgi:pantoate--beta-alanine ligase